MKALVLIAVCVSLVIAGCGGGGETPAATAGAGEGGQAKTGGDEPGPSIVIPDGPPPKKFIVRDLRKGTGRVARGGDKVTVRYIGFYWNGERDSNAWEYEAAPTFELGNHQLARPLDMGIRGMREGGRRELLAPPSLIFYPDVPHHRLGPEYSMIFKVDLLKVR